MNIGITQSDSKFHLYVPWIKNTFPEVSIIDLSYTQNNLEDLNKCHGIILTGGDDSHPKFYGNPREQYPNAPSSFNIKRDDFETRVMDFVLTHKVPVLGICRGMQFMNCHLGGDMVQDLQEAGKDDHRSPEGSNKLHDVRIEKESLLYELTGIEFGKVNTSHHQAVGRIPHQLKSVAISKDGVVEAIEGINLMEHFVLGVQWHPEWMKEEDKNPLSYRLRDGFVSAVRQYQQVHY